MTVLIHVLVPVLGRPHNVEPLVESFLEGRTVPSRLVFICSPTGDDPEQVAACHAARKTNEHVVVTQIGASPGPGDFARKINLAFRNLYAPFVFQAADDVMFCPGWDQAALDVAEATGAGVIGTNDHGNPTVQKGNHSTHSLIRRSYIETFGGTLDDGPGVVFHEAYGHQWCDTELVEIAKVRGQWAFAADSAVCHEHPFWDRTVPNDATYRKGQASAHADRRLYLQRRLQWARP